MKVTKKMKIISAISLIGVLAIVLACATTSNGTKEQDTQINTPQKWQQAYPHVFNNVGFSMLVESNVMIKNSPQNQQFPIGQVTNPYGIRDDVLEFIFKTIPSNNESATYAAIRLEQNQLQIYKTENESDAVYYANEGFLPIVCLSQALGSIGSSKYLDELDKIQRRTSDGKNMDKVIRQKLGWKVLGPQKPFKELESICEKGGY